MKTQRVRVVVELFSLCFNTRDFVTRRESQKQQNSEEIYR